MQHKTLSFSIAALVGFGGTLALAPDAHAAPPTLGQKALAVAVKKEGSPYKWGATGPNKFDCSGLTLYSFKSVGKKIPRVAQDQYNKSKHIAKTSRRVGDLVFFGGSSSIYHVGIYAGHGYIWHSPKPGAKVRKEKIWTSSVRYGRFS
jgi:cell wall-associated NlpC family hydrolase